MYRLLTCLILLALAAPAQAQTPLIPVGAFTQNPAQATQHKAMGINFYWHLWRANRPLATQLQQIAAAGMTVMGEDASARAQDALLMSSFTGTYGPQITGYLLGDEPDAGVWVAPNGCMPLTTITTTIGAIRSRDPVRPIGVNFSPGMGDPNWIGRGGCWGQHEEYVAVLEELDFAAFDVYPSQMPNGGGFEFRNDMRRIFDGVTLLRTFGQFDRPIYFPAHSIDLLCATNADNQPTWKEMRAQVFAGFVAGGEGPLWFGHCFPAGNENRWLELPRQVARLTSVNAEIQEHATFLRNPELSPGAGRVISVSPAGARVECRFALGRQNRHSAMCVNLDPRITATLTFHLGGAGSPMLVVKEGRLLNPGAGNLYTDTLAGPASRFYETSFGEPVPPPQGDPGAQPIEISAAWARSANPPGGAVGNGFGIGWFFDSPNRGAARFVISAATLSACAPSAAELRVSVTYPFGFAPVTTRGIKVGPWGGNLGSVPETTPASGRYVLQDVPHAPSSTVYATTANTIADSAGYKTIPLGGSILADLQAAAAAGQASFAFQGTNEGSGQTIWLEPHNAPNPPKLKLSCTQ